MYIYKEQDRNPISSAELRTVWSFSTYWREYSLHTPDLGISLFAAKAVTGVRGLRAN
jgi:hypothetical protein